MRRRRSCDPGLPWSKLPQRTSDGTNISILTECASSRQPFYTLSGLLKITRCLVYNKQQTILYLKIKMCFKAYRMHLGVGNALNNNCVGPNSFKSTFISIGTVIIPKCGIPYCSKPSLMELHHCTKLKPFKSTTFIVYHELNK